jgi:hypothetical protein
LLLINSISLSAQTHIVWQKKADTSSAGNERAALVRTDSYGNVYTIGSTNPAGSVYRDILVVKYDSLGNELWSAIFAGPSGRSENVSSAVIDKNNDLVLCGEYFNSSSINDVLIMKYSSTGQVMWMDTVDGPAQLYDKGFDLCVDDTNFIYITGYMLGSSYSAFMMKYDPNGNMLWNKLLPATQQGMLIRIYQGAIYLAALTGPTGQPSHTSLTKLDSAGNIVWTYPINSDYRNIIRNLVFKDSLIYLLDEFLANQSSKNYFAIVCLDTSGAFKWKKKFIHSHTTETAGLGMYDSLLYVTVTEYDDSTYSRASVVLRGISAISGDSVFHVTWPQSPGFKDVVKGQQVNSNGIVTLWVAAAGDSLGQDISYFLVVFNPDGTLSYNERMTDTAAGADCDITALTEKSLIVTATIISGPMSYYKISTWRFNDRITNIELVRSPEKILVFPNPSGGYVTVRNPLEGTAYWKIFDEKGALVRSGLFYSQESTIHLEIPPGFYFIQIQLGKLFLNDKFVVIH